MGDEGLERRPKTSGKEGLADESAALSAALPADLVQLLGCWQSLPADVRGSILEAVREVTDGVGQKG